MWRRLRGLSVDAFSEMPHAEKNFSHHVHDSSVEPCLKKSRPDYSSSWARGDTASYKEHEVKSQTWSFSTFSEERCHPSGRGGGGVDAQYNSELLKYRSGQGDANERDRNKTRQRPLVLPAREKPEYNPDKTFSATSTSFIGPLYRPSRQKKSLLGVTSNRNAALSYQITTVELGKLASQSKGQDGMDYELRQFYKELNALQAEADDQTKQVTYTDVDIKQGIGVYPDKTPTTHPTSYQHGQVPASQPLGPFPSTTNYQHGQVPASQPLGPFPSTTNYQHGQVPASQSLGPFPSTPSNLASLPCHAKEDARPPLPLNNQFSCDGHAPYHPTNSSFVSHAIPPPRFEGHHPPTFIVPYGPPPPRFNYPMTFPRQSNALPPPPSQNFNYNTRHGHPPWHGSPAPPDSRFTSPGSKPFLQSTGERTWPELQHDDLCRPEDGQFGDRILPHTGNVSHEQYRYGDKGKMVLLRGVPGSGKSTLARTLLQQSPDGIVLSTDDYFCEENGYTYDVKLLGDAHNWNQNRARRALDDGRSPVIIDNTNIQGWEMKPYVQMAVDRGYNIEFLEPDTWWKQDAHELEKRNTHRVPREKISQMLERYEYDLTVPVVMSSVEPRRTRPNRPPPEARPRTGNLKEKRHRKRYRKNRRKIASRKPSLSPQEDEGWENLAAEEKGSGYDVGDCMTVAEGIGRVQVKIYSGIGRYVSDYLHRSNRGTAALFGMVSRCMAPMDSPITQLIPETEILVTRRQCLLSSSLIIGGMLSKDTKSGRLFFNWLQACSKGLHVTDQAQDINTSLDLYCSLITFLAGETLHLYDMKCFKLKKCNCPKNPLPYRVSENQDEKSKQKCERFEDLETEISKHDSVQMMDTSKSHVETKLTTPVRQKRLRKVYKLAPTFQHPRIFSATQIRTWKTSCGDGASNLYTEADASQNPLENHDIRKPVTEDCEDNLTRRERSCRAKNESLCRMGTCEDDLYPTTFKCPDGQENSEVKRSYSCFLPGAQSCDRLCLPEQFARQLVELFGCPGVALDAFQPKDFIVPLGYDLARRIYLKWKKSLEVKYKLLPAK